MHPSCFSLQTAFIHSGCKSFDVQLNVESQEEYDRKRVQTFDIHLLIELLTDALRPPHMQSFAFARPVDVGHLDHHVGYHESVRLTHPINTRCILIIHLQADDIVVH